MSRNPSSDYGMDSRRGNVAMWLEFQGIGGLSGRQLLWACTLVFVSSSRRLANLRSSGTSGTSLRSWSGFNECDAVTTGGKNVSADSKRFSFPVLCPAVMASHSQPLAGPSLRSGFLTAIAKKHPIALFFILAYALGWAMVTPRILSWLGIVRFNVPDWWVAASFYAPAIAGLCMQWLTQQNLKVFRVYESLGRLVLGLVIGAFLVLVCNPSVAALLAERTPLHTLDWRIFLSLSAYHFYLFGTFDADRRGNRLAGLCAAKAATPLWPHVGLCFGRADVGWLHATRVELGSDVDCSRDSCVRHRANRSFD